MLLQNLDPHSGVSKAEVYLALGDVDKAIEYLRRSYDLRIPDMIGIGVDPMFHSLHGHSEFERILHDQDFGALLCERTGQCIRLGTDVEHTPALHATRELEHDLLHALALGRHVPARLRRFTQSRSHRL